MSSYYYICVLILLYMCPHTTVYVCVLILLYMCPHTAIYVSSYSYICVLILLYMCPHTNIYTCPHNMCPPTTIYVSSYYYIYVLMQTSTLLSSVRKEFFLFFLFLPDQYLNELQRVNTLCQDQKERWIYSLRQHLNRALIGP